MADLDEFALAMPQTTKGVSDDGRPAYFVHGKLFCCHRSGREGLARRAQPRRLNDPGGNDEWT